MDNNTTDHDIQKVKILNGETIAYREAGDPNKTPLLLLHFAMISSKFYTPYFHHFTESFHVIAPDFRGHGQSSCINPPTSIDDFVEDLKQFVDVLGLKRIVLFGWFISGPVSLRFAAKYPEYVIGIILHCSARSRGYPSYTEGIQPSEIPKTKEEINSQPIAQFFIETVLQKKREPMISLIENWVFNGKAKATSKHLDMCAEDAFNCKCSENMFSIFSSYNLTDKNNMKMDGTNDLSKVRCRVLILHGAKDNDHPKEEAMELKEVLGDSCQIKIFEESGNAVIHDYPDSVTCLINEFCASLT